MSLRKFIFWDYERGSWQYDIFCLLIIAFIFLTPKAWFNKTEQLATQTSGSVVERFDLFQASGSAKNYLNGKNALPKSRKD